MSFEGASEGDSVRGFARNLILLLQADLHRWKLEGRRVPVSFSGGLDSTLIAKVCSDLAETYCIVAGAPGSIDLKNARTSAEKLDLELVEVSLDEERVLEGAREICRITGSKDPLTVSFELPTYLSLRRAKEDVIITGQGADELFGGYAKYEGLTAEEFDKNRREDIGKVLGPIEAMESEIAAHWGKSIVRPFLCNHIVSFAMALPLEAVRPSNARKPIIREALRELGMADVASMPKKASQYGSGVSNLLKKAAKKRGESLGRMIADLAEEGAS